MDTGDLYDKSFFRQQQDGALVSARVIVPEVLELLGPVRSVIDVGCGTGSWLSVFAHHGVGRVFGVDGDYVERDMLRIPRESFAPRDLFQPVTLDERFDLACSLEVAEHLPPERGESFIGELTALAPVVLFSAAIPGQGGVHHINERWPDYWAQLFRERGFLPIDAIRPRIWRDRRVEWWYAQNTLLFATEAAIAENPALARARAATHEGQLSLVHPRRFVIGQRIIAKLEAELRKVR